MGRHRAISTDMSTDRLIGRLEREYGDFPSLLYTRMIPHASEEGTLTGFVDELKARVFPLRSDKTDHDVEQALYILCKIGLISWCRQGEKHLVYFPVKSFYAHQTQIPATKRRAADYVMGENDYQLWNTEEDLPLTQDSEEQQETPKNTSYSSSSLSSSPHTPNGGFTEPEQSEEKEKERRQVADWFAMFWCEYPKKKSKDAALRAFERKVRDSAIFGAVMDGLRVAKLSHDWRKENGQFVPHPATWLNAGGWKDESGATVTLAVSSGEPLTQPVDEEWRRQWLAELESDGEPNE